MYEVDLGDGSAPRMTTRPVTLIEPLLGAREAGAVIAAADHGWTGGVGPWASH
jgi:hypothetical protein